MLPLFVLLQTQVAGRPSGTTYVLTMLVAAAVAGVLVALVSSRSLSQNRPKRDDPAPSPAREEKVLTKTH